MRKKNQPNQPDRQKKPKKAKKRLHLSPRLRYGTVSTLILCLVLALLAVLNGVMSTLEKKNGWRVDFSFNALTTQSEKTLEILEQLPYPVHIYALFTKGQEDAPLEELLDRYAAASSLVTWEETDPSLNPGLLTKFRGATESDAVSSDSLIVYCETTDRWRILSPSDFVTVSLNYEEGVYEVAGLKYESEITSAIDYVTRETIPRVLIVQGHGELDEDSTEAFRSLLESNHFSVEYVSLLDNDLELTADDLVVLLSPTHDLMDAELEKLTAFTGQGGNLLITCDYSDPVDSMSNYQALLRSYGFLPKTGIVVASTEEPDTYYDNIRIDLIPEMLSTDMTMQLVSAGSSTLLLTGSRAFEESSEADRNLTVYTLLRSGEKSYLKDMSTGSLSLEQADGDETGPFALAMQAQRVTTEGYISKAVILGCSTLLTSDQV